MSNIDLRNFVDINIKKHLPSVVIGSRDTVALFTETNTGEEGTHTKRTFNKYSDIATAFPGNENLLAHAKTYFDHGGRKLLICEGYATVTKDDIVALPDEIICVAFAKEEASNLALLTAAQALASDVNVYGIKEKIVCDFTNDKTSTANTKNYAVKYSGTYGDEMTIPAYLSQIDVHGIDTVHDYAFTIENVELTDAQNNLTNAEFKTLIQNGINVDILLAGAVRNTGGNCTDGEDLTNAYVRILLHQTTTDRLIQVLTTKLKSNAGLGKLYSAIAQEMNYYRTNGYLSGDKIWKESDLKVEYNGETYTVVEKGTPLVNGYVAKILPLSSLTEDDIAEHKAPLIYLVIADQYSIRKITIHGEVI